MKDHTLLNREFLDVALLRLRIRSIVAAESGANPSVPLGSYSCADPQVSTSLEPGSDFLDLTLS